MKLCKDCVYYQPDAFRWNNLAYQQVYALCSRTAKVTDMDGTMCSDERGKLWFGCGKNARYFEGKAA